MNLTQFTRPAELERNSFMWSQARLVIAAAALLLGGVPPLTLLLGSSPGVWSLLRIFWIISGVASAYLGYRWFTGGQRVFGGKDNKDTAAFLVSVVTGLNLGWTGLAGNNIGMSIASGKVIFIVVGVLYLVSAWHLQNRYRAYGKKLF